MNFFKALGKLFLVKIKFPNIEHTPEGYDVLSGGNDRIERITRTGLKAIGVLNKDTLADFHTSIALPTDDEIEAHMSGRNIEITDLSK